jgi:BirA family transcriptional regulator, biotin operon repressor / biotin---[acetyl-CoA-carboxylase] ligase
VLDGPDGDLLLPPRVVVSIRAGGALTAAHVTLPAPRRAGRHPGPLPYAAAVERVIEWRLEHRDVTDSTNVDVGLRARAGERQGLVITAGLQRAGRGRLDRNWTAPSGSSLAASVLLRPDAPARRLGWLPLLAGVAVVDALTPLLPARRVLLKWPNDVLVQGEDGEQRKVCGVLAELIAPALTWDGPAPAGTPSPAVVVGVGINISQDTDQLPVPTATSLRLAGADPIEPGRLCELWLVELDRRYRAWLAAGGDPVASGLLERFRSVCVTLGSRVRVQLPQGGVAEGLALDVDDSGQLVLDVDDVSGPRRTVLAAGDVVQLRPASS